jgi:hypothetical protein
MPALKMAFWISVINVYMVMPTRIAAYDPGYDNQDYSYREGDESSKDWTHTRDRYARDPGFDRGYDQRDYSYREGDEAAKDWYYTRDRRSGVTVDTRDYSFREGDEPSRDWKWDAYRRPVNTEEGSISGYRQDNDVNTVDNNLYNGYQNNQVR